MVLPLWDEKVGRRLFPAVTILVIVANVAAFLVELGQGARIEGFFQMWAVIPAEYHARTDLPPVHPFPFWATLFTSMFLHGGLLHLGGNMLYLWIFGDNVEDAMGHGRFLVFYLLCGVAASLAQVAVNPASQIPSLGASGAISGVLAAYVVLFPARRVAVLLIRSITYVPAYVVIGFWILLQFVNGLGQLAQTEETGGVAYAAHVGGFVAGIVLVWLFRRRN